MTQAKDNAHYRVVSSETVELNLHDRCAVRVVVAHSSSQILPIKLLRVRTSQHIHIMSGLSSSRWQVNYYIFNHLFITAMFQPESWGFYQDGCPTAEIMSTYDKRVSRIASKMTSLSVSWPFGELACHCNWSHRRQYSLSTEDGQAEWLTCYLPRWPILCQVGRQIVNLSYHWATCHCTCHWAVL